MNKIKRNVKKSEQTEKSTDDQNDLVAKRDDQKAHRTGDNHLREEIGHREQSTVDAKTTLGAERCAFHIVLVHVKFVEHLVRKRVQYGH